MGRRDARRRPARTPPQRRLSGSPAACWAAAKRAECLDPFLRLVAAGCEWTMIEPSHLSISRRTAIGSTLDRRPEWDTSQRRRPSAWREPTALSGMDPRLALADIDLGIGPEGLLGRSPIDKPASKSAITLSGRGTGDHTTTPLGGIIAMNAPNEHSTRKGLRAWWADPPRSGMQRLLAPWQYRHARLFGACVSPVPASRPSRPSSASPTARTHGRPSSSSSRR